MFKTPRPRENPTPLASIQQNKKANETKGISGGLRSNRIRASLPPLLMLSIMSCNCPMRRLSLNCLPIRRHKNGCHQSQRSVSLGNNITLHVSVIVFAGPDETAAGFQSLGYHVVDEAMFIPDFLFFELRFVFPIKISGQIKVQKAN